MNKIILSAFICLITTASFGCMRVSYDVSDDNLQILHEKTFSISEGKLLKLNTPSGKISVSSWDKNEVYVKISGNENAKNKVEFNFNNNSDVVEVTAKTKSSFLGIKINNFQLVYEIKVPKNFNAEGKTSGGDLYIENINGNIKMSTSGGNVNARNLAGDFNASTSGGDIKLDNITGKTNISTSGGDINAKGFNGDFSASTSGGNVRLSGSNAKIRAVTSGGNIELDYTGENKGVELSTSGGNITLMLPKDFNASALIHTSGGNIDSDFRGNNAVKISSTRFQADLNKGGSPLTVKTSGGDITLKSKN